MSNRIEIAYVSFAKIIVGSLGLSLLVYVFSGVLSQVFFECVQIPSSDVGTTAQLCELYRPFFLLELVTSRSATIMLALVAFLSMSMLVGALIWHKAFMRECGIVGVCVLIVFLSYRYFGARTLLLADFSNQKSYGVLKSVTFKTKCPWRSWSCLSSDNNSLGGTSVPPRTSE